MKILENLYGYIWRGAGNNCNSYILAGEVPTLIDPGHLVNELKEPCFHQLLASMSKDGFKPEDIRLIINTHAHPDHCEANQAIVERSGAKVAFHREEAKSMRTIFEIFGMPPPQFGPDFYLTDGELSLGLSDKINLTVFHTPGHSPGSITLYWPDEKVLITGDLIFPFSVGRTDIPGGNIRLLKESIERLAELEVEYLLAGHLGMLKGKEKAQRNFSYILKAFF